MTNGCWQIVNGKRVAGTTGKPPASGKPKAQPAKAEG